MTADRSEDPRANLRPGGPAPERMVSHAANAEDVVLHRALCIGGVVGRYVDVGASSPYLGSVTRHFYEAGWKGIDVEPLAEEAAELRRARPRDVVIEAALGSAAGEVTLYVVGDERGLSSTDAEVGAGYVRAGRPVRERKVRQVTLAEVLDEHCDGEITFLKVDVEGAEPEVLSGNDWSRWRPRVVVVEATDPWSYQQTHARWEPQLLAAGYLFASFDGINRFYARSEEPDLLTRLAPASVLDNFVSENLNRVEGYVRHLEAELKARSAHVSQLETFVAAQEEIIHARDSRIADLEARVRPRTLPGGGRRAR
ncbi:MAG: FkbM family methyltransferase [Acidimicrobiales bacterium]